MHEELAPSDSGECATDGADPALPTGSSISSSDGSCDREGPREVPSEAATAGMGDGDVFAVEGSEAVRLLDEELEELEKLMVFQRKKIDALGRLRRQWLTGERCECSYAERGCKLCSSKSLTASHGGGPPMEVVARPTLTPRDQT